jgi:glycosyltransferase involved in cell wall biosynthesis
MATPLLSVCFANYNYARYLKKCLTGILNQTFGDFEVIITDDGSTDGSQDILREYARVDSRLKVNYFAKNQGLGPASKDVFSRMTGRYFYSTASDDFVINKDFFIKAVTALEKDPRPAGFYGLCGIYIDEKNKLSGGMGTAEVEGYNTPVQCCEGFLKCRSVVTTPSCIFRTQPFFAQNGRDFHELIRTLGPQVDYYFNHSVAFRLGMFYEKTLFSCQRIYEARTNYSANLQLWDTASRFAEMERLLKEDGLPTYPGIEQDWPRWRAYWMMDTIRKSGVAV